MLCWRNLFLVLHVAVLFADEGKYTRLGMEFDAQGRFEESRSAFETAAKNWPSTQTLVNLGVCLMRRASGSRDRSAKFELYHSAYQAMAEGGQYALSDSDHKLYRENWNALMTNFKLESIPLPSPEDIEPQACGPIEIDETDDLVDSSKQEVHEINRPFLVHERRRTPLAPPFMRLSINSTQDFPKNKPFILTGAMNDWLIPENGWDLLTQLAKAWPKAVTDFYPYNMLSKARRSPFLTRLHTAVVELGLRSDSQASKFKQKPGISEQQGRYMHLQLSPKQWQDLGNWGILHDRQQLSSDKWLDECFANNTDLVNEFHIKTHWKILLAGSRGAGMFNHSDSLQTSSWHAHLKGRKWWYVCRDSFCFEEILEPGDILFYGQGWYHETQNLDTPTITLTDTFINAFNYKAVSRKLLDECATASLNFRFSAQLCDALDSCPVKLAHIFDDKDDNVILSSSWRKQASSKLLTEREITLPSHNNYDGRNYITE